mmetsp:Transcript_13526/g.36510  ORF Transcript_13526/g.36510 Transcript_13526/m.36510 type:complete len:181 (-) Transcript_13526:985-1527(-)
MLGPRIILAARRRKNSTTSVHQDHVQGPIPSQETTSDPHARVQGPWVTSGPIQTAVGRCWTSTASNLHMRVRGLVPGLGPTRAAAVGQQGGSKQCAQASTLRQFLDLICAETANGSEIVSVDATAANVAEQVNEHASKHETDDVTDRTTGRSRNRRNRRFRLARAWAFRAEQTSKYHRPR